MRASAKADQPDRRGARISSGNGASQTGHHSRCRPDEMPYAAAVNAAAMTIHNQRRRELFAAESREIVGSTGRKIRARLQ